MCNTRAYRHTCGHATIRHLSSCRGTYADPKGAVVLCSATPALMVTVRKPCSGCQYKALRDDWEHKLASAEEKQFVATQMLRDFEDDSSDCSEFDDGLVGGGDDKSSGFSGDVSRVARERNLASQEVHRLKTQYERDILSQWSNFVRIDQTKRIASALRQPRHPVPRKAGSSPLKHVNNLVQPVADTSELHEEKQWCTTAMSRSPSLTSVDSDSSEDSGEDIEMAESPDTFLPKNRWTFATPNDTKDATMDGLRMERPVTGTAISGDDPDDHMLPDYGF